MNSNLNQAPKRKLWILSFAFSTVVFVVYYSWSTRPIITEDYLHNIKNSFDIFKNDRKSIENLKNSDEKPIYKGKNIFFLDERMDANKTINLLPREACSVEAAARLHPDSKVFLIYSREVGFFNETPLPLIDAISSYKNVHLRFIDLYEYSENTPVEAWIHGAILSNSTSLYSHSSDILKILTLWWYTGTFLELDVILQKRVDEIGANFACVQKNSVIGSAVLNFDSVVGRKIAEDFMNEIVLHYNPDAWKDKGQELLTKIVHKMCNSTEISKMTREACHGFLVLPRSSCYEIDSSEWIKFFDEKLVDQVMKRVKISLAVNFWNALSKNRSLSSNSKSAFIAIAKKFCPKVLKASGKTF